MARKPLRRSRKHLIAEETADPSEDEDEHAWYICMYDDTGRVCTGKKRIGRVGRMITWIGEARGGEGRCLALA